MELDCSIKNYAWGKKGIDSLIASLMKSSNPDFLLNDGLPYAELWMGTHPSGPSFLKNKNISLDDYIKKNKYVLGDALIEIYGGKIPFLFKVLSIQKALSLQVHPNKKQAELLHQTKPEIYKDANHKPELAIALTPFEALCGFRPISEIKDYIKTIPELCLAIGENQVANLFSNNESNLQNALKKCFISLISQKPEIISQQLKKLISRLSNLDETTRQRMNANLLERLYSEYPDDVGCFSIYLFNYMILKPGEAIYLKANEAHAYLFGDCIECMSCSDNVIRAGLTSKMKDTETLADMLSYVCEPGSDKRFQSLQEDEFTELFEPPIQDFAVAKINIPSGKLYNTISRSTASILIVITGKAEISNSQVLNQGSVLFVPAHERININVFGCSNSMLIFQAFANIK